MYTFGYDHTQEIEKLKDELNAHNIHYEEIKNKNTVTITIPGNVFAVVWITCRLYSRRFDDNVFNFRTTASDVFGGKSRRYSISCEDILNILRNAKNI